MWSDFTQVSCMIALLLSFITQHPQKQYEPKLFPEGENIKQHYEQDLGLTSESLSCRIALLIKKAFSFAVSKDVIKSLRKLSLEAANQSFLHLDSISSFQKGIEPCCSCSLDNMQIQDMTERVYLLYYELCSP